MSLAAYFCSLSWKSGRSAGDSNAGHHTITRPCHIAFLTLGSSETALSGPPRLWHGGGHARVAGRASLAHSARESPRDANIVHRSFRHAWRADDLRSRSGHGNACLNKICIRQCCSRPVGTDAHAVRVAPNLPGLCYCGFPSSLCVHSSWRSLQPVRIMAVRQCRSIHQPPKPDQPFLLFKPKMPIILAGA